MRLKSLFILLLLFLSSVHSFAKEVGIDATIDKQFSKITEWSEKIIFYSIPGTKQLEIPGFGNGVPIVLILLVVTAVFLTVKFSFVNVFGLKTAFQTIIGKFGKKDDPGEISHFQALTSALSATVGLGNIAGVAVAISIGGAGATFWMILCGLFGMTTKFCECTLGVKYREIDENGKVHGGGMYYLSKGLAEIGLAPVGKVLAILFAIFCIFGSFGAGNMFQGNQAFAQTQFITGGEASFFAGKGWLFGLILASAVGACIIGGIKWIGRITATLVPLMCGAYLLAAAYILFVNAGEIPAALGKIVMDAFSFEAGVGGFLGVLLTGFKRAAFSNEAGLGSAPIAHAAVKTTKPASEGYVALLEPFLDTVVVCTMTALVIIITGKNVPDGAGWAEAIVVTSKAFGSVIDWFPYVLFVAVVLFAFSTMISWSYYGLQAWTYLFGSNKKVELAYQLLFCFFVVVGCSASMGNVLGFSDAMVFAMVFPNLIGIYFLLPKVKEEVQKYKEHRELIKSGGKKNDALTAKQTEADSQ